MLAYFTPEEAGFAEDRLQRVYRELEEAAASGLERDRVAGHGRALDSRDFIVVDPGVTPAEPVLLAGLADDSDLVVHDIYQ